MSREPRPLHNLPREVTSFVGRAREVADLAALLARGPDGCPLLTLAGSGGVGKTRLALQVAARVLPECPDGVWLVDLAPLRDPALVPAAVAAAVGVREVRDRPLDVTLADHLRSRRLLLVLDNCEHLVGACADLAGALLPACPNLCILATSREALRIAGETVWPVQPLPLPAPSGGSPGEAALADSAAVRLFLDRAAAADSRLAAAPPDLASVAEICRRLDGLPLAIELAAARVRVLSVEQILARLADRFRLLAGGERGAPAHRQTLRATVDWSYDLLAPPEQVLFARLAVFAGGFTLDAAEAVCGDEDDEGRKTKDGSRSGPSSLVLRPQDVLDLLARLVDKSLVQTEAATGSGVRYRFLETLREYAAERLRESGEEARLRNRHLAYYAALAERAEPELQGPEQRAWLDRLEDDLDNLRAAIGWAVEQAAPGAVEAGLRLAGAVGMFCALRAHVREGREWAESLLALSPGAEPAAPRTKALVWAAVAARFLGDAAAGRARADEAAAGLWAIPHGGDRHATVTALDYAWLLSRSRVPRDAVPSLVQALAALRAVDDLNGVGYILRELGRAALRAGDYATARRDLEESLAVYRQARNRGREAGALHSLGYAIRAAGDAADSRRYHEEALAIWQELGYEHGVAGALNGLGEVALQAGDAALARSYLVPALDGYLAVGGRDGEALVRRNLAILAAREGDAGGARAFLVEALGYWRSANMEYDVAETFETFAVRAAAAEPQWALALAGAAAAVRDAADWPLPPLRRAALDAGLAAARQALGEAEAEATLARGRTLSLHEAIDEAISAIAAAAPAFPVAAGAPIAPGPTVAPKPQPREGAADADTERPPQSPRAPDAAAGAVAAQPGPGAAPVDAIPRDAGPAACASVTGGAGTAADAPPLRVDAATHTVWRGGAPLHPPLSVREFALLRYLDEHRQRVCTRTELGDAVWGAHAWDPNMLHHLIRRLKEKLEPDPARPRYLRTVSGVGYQLVA